MGKQSENALPDIGTYAACRYCGQIHRVSDEDIGDAEAIELATMACDCTEAKTYQRRKRRKKQIEDKLYQDYGNEDAEVCKLREGVYNLLMMAADLVADMEIEKCSIQLNDVEKIDVRMKKDRVKVKLTKKMEAESEA